MISSISGISKIMTMTHTKQLMVIFTTTTTRTAATTTITYI
jgi:hypothetical protein